jgi:hypothetical protein
MAAKYIEWKQDKGYYSEVPMNSSGLFADVQRIADQQADVVLYPREQIFSLTEQPEFVCMIQLRSPPF